MRLKETLAKWLVDVLAYHPATQHTTVRSWIQGGYDDARKDLSSGDRKELQRLSRAHEQGDALCNRMADLWEQYIVGQNGLLFFADSSSPEWNTAADKQFAAWMPFADVSTRDGWGCSNGKLARRWFFDGEIFIILTTENGFPRIQLVEAHRCMSPERPPKGAGPIYDGVEVNPSSGRPVRYWFKLGETDELTPVEASYVVHVFEPSRPGQYRGIPLISCVLNDLRDLADLQHLEMKAAKLAARIGIVQKNKAGELPASDMIRQRFSVGNTSATGATTSQTRSDYYASSVGNDVLVLNSGDEIQQFMNNRPSVASREYWQYLVGKICMGVGIPDVICSPSTMQGTVYRGSLDAAAAFFNSRSSALAVHLQRVWEWVIGNDVALIRGRPADWKKTSVRFPKSINVDIGRNSSAAINELAAGLCTYQSLYGEEGLDWKREIEQRAKEAAYIKEMAVKHGVEPSDIAANSLKNAEATQTQATE